MIKKSLWVQKGFTLVEILVATAIVGILLAAVVTFSNSSLSMNRSVVNQSDGMNQMKNAFNYISRDAQMAGMVDTPDGTFVELSWINYPTNLTTVVYTIDTNGTLTRTETSSTPSTLTVATDVNTDPYQTNVIWDSTNKKLTINLSIIIGGKNTTRQFVFTPRVIQSSAQQPNTITGSSSPNPQDFGSIVNFTAALSPSSITSGTVTFFNNGSPIATAPVVNGSVSYPISNLPVGTYSHLKAVFSGDALYSSSTSAEWSQIIAMATTTTTLVSSPATSILGQSVTLTATVTPVFATGTVTFKDGATVIGTGTLDGSGHATCTTTTLTAGNHLNITAKYEGDANCNPSVSSAISQTVNKIATAIVISNSSPNPSALGSAVTFTAYVTPIAATGTVTFYDGISNPIGTGILDGSGHATCTTTVLSASTHTDIYASYGGDSSYQSSTSPNYTQTVIGAVNAARSTLLPAAANVVANGIATQVLTVQAKDANSNNLFTGGAIVLITLNSGTGTVGGVTDNGNGTYTAIVTAPSTTGNGVFSATLNGSSVNNTSTITYILGNNIDILSNMNWSAITTGTGPGGLPSSADTVNIHGNYILTVDVPNGRAYAINVNTGDNSQTGTLKFNANQGVTVGTITLGNSTSNRIGALNMSSGGSLTITNSVVLGGNNYTFTQGTGTVVYGGGNQTVISMTNPYYNLMLDGSGTKTLGGAITVNRDLTIDTGVTLDTGATNSWTLSVTGITSISGTLKLNNTGNKTFSGDVTINAGGVWNEIASAAVNYAGNLTNNGITFTTSTGTHTFSGAVKTIGGTGIISIPKATFTGTYTNNGTLTCATLLTVTSPGVLTNSGIVNATTALSGTGGLTQRATGVLNISGTSAITTLTTSAAGNTVNYTGAAQTVKTTTYSNVILSGSGAKTIASGTVINGRLTIAPTGTATASIAAGATISVNALTLTITSEPSGTWGSTSSTATNKTNTYFAATTGKLNVLTGP